MAHVRPFETSDTAALYEVCLSTADNGKDASLVFTDPKILGEVYVGAYLKFAPEGASVVDVEGLARGYTLSVADTAEFERLCDAEWWPALRERYPLGSFPAGTEDEAVVAIIHNPPHRDPAILHDYPAHLHIDLMDEVQGIGLGSSMMKSLLEAQRAAGVRGIHLDVSSTNTRAIGFYKHLGFTDLQYLHDSTLMGLRFTTD